MRGQCGWVGPRRVGQNCSHGQKIQAWLAAFGIQREGKGAAGGERDGRAGRKDAEKAEHRVEGALPFPPGKGPAASALLQLPNPAWPPFAGAERLATPLLITSHHAQTKTPIPEGNSRGSAARAGRDTRGGRDVLAHSTGKLAWLATPHWLSAPFSRWM